MAMTMVDVSLTQTSSSAVSPSRMQMTSNRTTSGSATDGPEVVSVKGAETPAEHGTEAELDDALSRDDLYPDHVLVRLHTLSVEDPGDDALHPWLPQT